MVKQKNGAYVGIRMPIPLEKVLTHLIKKGTYISKSEFVRAALREKINREAPELLVYHKNRKSTK